MEELKARLVAFIVDEVAPHLEIESIADDEPLIDSGIVDSLGVLRIMAFLDEEFEIDLGSGDIWENFKDLRTISAAVELEGWTPERDAALAAAAQADSTLEDDHPDVGSRRSLVTTVPDDLRSALEDFSYNDYLHFLPAVSEQEVERTPVRLAVLRSYTAEAIEPILRMRFLLEGYAPETWLGGYNQYQIEILDPASELHTFKPDLVLMMVRLDEILPEFVESYASRTVEEWQGLVEGAADELGALARKAASELSAQVIVQNAVLDQGPYFGVFDPQREVGQEALVNTFNQRLSAATATPGVFVWDFEGFTRSFGAEQLHDAKMWYFSSNPYKQSAYPAIAADIMRYALSALGRIKKCVVLDLDNTLWGGVAGEDGLEGVVLGDTYPGNCFKDFQKQLLRLYHRGIVLGIASKNNEEDAYRIIDEHPDMILKREHFAATRINWKDKASNLRELAAELNIGLDTFVFVDDNPAECALVKEQLPEVEVVMVPSKPHDLPRIASRLPTVENIRLTDEDRRKGEMYRAQSERRELESTFAATDLESFLASLDMRVGVEEATPFSIPRIAQLTQKTNQMNMATRRYTEAQIRALSEQDGWALFAVSAEDKFGDHGIIGVLMLERVGDGCRIDNFLLSCRVIGRGVESSMVDRALEQAASWGSKTLIGEFFPTRKNVPAAGFYEKSGFKKCDTDESRYVRSVTS